MNPFIQYGIDLGTTNSCIARWEGSDVRVFQNNDASFATPSAVWIRKSGQKFVGRRAYGALSEDPANIALEFKRWMGQRDRVRFPAAGLSLSAEELSADVLRALLDDVRRHTGEDVHAAVITVPAAFGTLQCEATARAATLAGITDCHLLQEPIAAGVAYGASAGAMSGRWLVFDLGGGTLDLAVVSTRGGRLTVLEHRGDNQLGGKDLDLAILEHLVVPVLERSFQLPARDKDPAAWKALMNHLRPEVESEKIRLSAVEATDVIFTGRAKDMNGTPIECSIRLERGRVEELIQPLLDRCMSLAREVVAAARLTPSEIERVLLVGGPTQMPVVRRTIEKELGIPIDHSQDPLTVVARGAAIYAAGVERKVSTPEPVLGEAALVLAYDPVTSEPSAVVSGRIVQQATPDGVVDVKVDTSDGAWSSGWLRLQDGCFDACVPLQPGRVAECWVTARDGHGRPVTLSPATFSLRQGLALDSPPLPHTLWVELREGAEGTETEALDLLLRRGTQLPATVTRLYRTTHALSPRAGGPPVAIKLYEGEVPQDPRANEFIGAVELTDSQIGRALPAGSDVELTIRVDASRRVTVSAFIPRLDEVLEEGLWLAVRSERDLAEAVADLNERTREQYVRLERLEEAGAAPQEVEATRNEIEQLDHALAESRSQAGEDPDTARRLVEQSRRVEQRLAELRARAEPKGVSAHAARSIAELIDNVRQHVHEHGTAEEQRELELLANEARKALDTGHARSVQRTKDALDDLARRVLRRQPWFWRSMLDHIRSGPFMQPQQAAEVLAEADRAVARGDGRALQAAVQELLELLPRSREALAREQVQRSGLRR